MIQPGKWAFAQGENFLSIHPSIPGPAAVASTLLELQRAVPIPKDDVPLQEILEFKYRRRDELMLFRVHFEALASEISISEDPAAALDAKLQDIDHACANLLEVSREWQWPVRLGSMNASVSFEPVKMMTNAAKAYSLAREKGLGLTASTAIAGGTAALSTVSFKPSGFGLQNIRRAKSPYRYAYSINEELGYLSR